MTTRLAVVAMACAVVVTGCTSASPGSVDGPTRPGATATTTSGQAAPTPSPTPTQGVSADVSEAAVLGTGTVTVDGTELQVSGDCDISREFGQQPVGSLDDGVDVVLTVDNLTGDGGHDGSFPFQVRLRGRGDLVGRRLVSEGAPGEEGAALDTTYEGEIEVAELRDRRELAFVDVAMLHLEASQHRTRGDEGPRRRSLTLDVACPISRPPG